MIANTRTAEPLAWCPATAAARGGECGSKGQRAVWWAAVRQQPGAVAGQQAERCRRTIALGGAKARRRHGSTAHSPSKSSRCWGSCLARVWPPHLNPHAGDVRRHRQQGIQLPAVGQGRGQGQGRGRGPGRGWGEGEAIRQHGPRQAAPLGRGVGTAAPASQPRAAAGCAAALYRTARSCTAAVQRIAQCLHAQSRISLCVALVCCHVEGRRVLAIAGHQRVTPGLHQQPDRFCTGVMCRKITPFNKA